MTNVRLLFSAKFSDMLSGYRIFSRRFVKSFPAQAKGFEIETELTVHALELQLPVAERSAPDGARPEVSVSKLNTYRDGVRILVTIAKMLKNEKPLHCFQAPGEPYCWSQACADRNPVGRYGGCAAG